MTAMHGAIAGPSSTPKGDRMDITDAHVVVTGGSRGIGEAIAREFSGGGAE